MEVSINGRGSISAAGDTPAAAAYYANPKYPNWSVDAATGMPVYRIGQLPAHAGIEAFADKRPVDRSALLALYAADQAVEEAGWREEEFAILIGSSRGPTGKWEAGYDYFRETGRAKLRTSPETTLGGIGFALSAYFGTSALASSMSVTCSSGFHALLHGVALLEAGMVRRVLVGGAEAPITPFTLRQMQALGIYAKAPKPEVPWLDFANKPGGMVMGEGAAFFALSKAGPGATITGIGFSQERSPSLTGISREGLALQHSMRGTLTAVGGAPDVIVAHLPGTRRGDDAERQAITAVFGEAYLARIASAKFATGHTFGASGPLALDFALSLLRAGDKNYRRAMVNATGFGGNAISVVVGK